MPKSQPRRRVENQMWNNKKHRGSAKNTNTNRRRSYLVRIVWLHAVARSFVHSACTPFEFASPSYVPGNGIVFFLVQPNGIRSELICYKLPPPIQRRFQCFLDGFRCSNLFGFLCLSYDINYVLFCNFYGQVDKKLQSIIICSTTRVSMHIIPFPAHLNSIYSL